MKTTLMDMAKMNATNTANVNVSRTRPTPPKNVESNEFRSTADDSRDSFNKTLKEEQQSSETKFEVTSKKPEKNPEKATRNEEVREGGETPDVSQDQKMPEEQEMAEKVVEQGVPVQSEETVEPNTKEALQGKVGTAKGEQSQSEIKMKTLISLFAGDKKNSLPKVESYISNLRKEGKSTSEILSTLQKITDEREGKSKTTLKDYVLKVKRVKVEEQSEPMLKKGTKVKQIVEVKSLTKIDTPSVSDVSKKPDTPKIAEKGEESVNVQDNKGGRQQIPVQAKATVEKGNTKAESSLVGEVDVKVVTDRGAEKPNNANGKSVNTLKGEVTVPEKLVKFLENFEKIDFDKISSFFESKLIPKEEIERFINSFDAGNVEEFVEKNESILSQLSSFSKLSELSEAKTSVPSAKTVLLRSSVVQQFIVRNFSTKTFSDDLWDTRSSLVFKAKEIMQPVQKMTLSFERIVQSPKKGIGSSRGVMTNESPRPAEASAKAEQSSTNTLVKSAFLKTGYASLSNRRGTLSQISEHSVEPSKDVRVVSGQSKEISDFKVLAEKTQNVKTEQMAEAKTQVESKDTKEMTTGEAVSRSDEKATTSFTATALNRQTVNSTNLEQVYQRISDMSRLMERQMTKVETATIQLTPPELGKVSLEIVKEGSKVSVFMQVETKEAQEILQRNSELLGTKLANSGFELQKVQIHMEKYEEQGADQQNPNADSQNSQDGESEKNNSDESDSKHNNETEYSFEELLRGGIEDAS